MTGFMQLFVKMYVLLHNCQKMYTNLFTLAVFSIGPLVRIHPKIEVTQKGKGCGIKQKCY